MYAILILRGKYLVAYCVPWVSFVFIIVIFVVFVSRSAEVLLQLALLPDPARPHANPNLRLATGDVINNQPVVSRREGALLFFSRDHLTVEISFRYQERQRVKSERSEQETNASVFPK